VCDSLGVPLELVPLTDAYWDEVVSESVSEIRAGRTPNPDMLCNSRVKYGAFYDYLAARPGASFERVASGHYARVVREGGAGERRPGAGGACLGLQRCRTCRAAAATTPASHSQPRPAGQAQVHTNSRGDPSAGCSASTKGWAAAPAPVP
jgi:hypothetical protein